MTILALAVLAVHASAASAGEFDMAAYSKAERDRALELSLKKAEQVEPWEEGRAPSLAQPPSETAKKSPFRLEGYYKNIFATSKTAGDTNEGYFYDLQRLRLDGRYEMSDKWQARAVVDQEILVNDFRDTPDFQVVKNKNQHTVAYLDGDKIWADTKHVYADSSLYRGYVKYHDDEVQVVAGKQMVDWGRFRFYSPMDLFNPISPMSIEKDERIGVDAVNAEFSLSPDSSLNAVYAPRRTFKTSSGGLRYYQKTASCDIFAMAGEFKKDKVLGAALDGYLGQGGIRGEFTQTFADNGRAYLRGALGYEYNFPNKLYLLCEYFYNGGADDTDPAALATSYEFASRVLSLNRNLLNIMLEYEMTPLLKLDNYTVYDLDRRSLFVNPEFKYNAFSNFDIITGGQIYCGNAGVSEFGNYKNLYYMQGKYFF